MDDDCSNVRRIVEGATIDFFPAAAPRGKGVVFISDRDGTFDLYTTTTKGDPVKHVTDSPVADTCPIWSPKGNDIAFDRFTDTSFDLYRAHQDGTALQRLSDSANADEIAPAWSPDGQLLVYLKCEHGSPSGCDLVVKNADGSGTETTLLNGGAGAPDSEPISRQP